VAAARACLRSTRRLIATPSPAAAAQGHPDGVEAQPADRGRQLDAGEPAPGHPVFSRIDDLKQGAVGEIVGRPKSGPATMTVVV
jgi:hypothetical protein